ncbi:MAG: HK97 gp10 family phage protein [Anaerovoracaceae bacterium]|jgi:hypothetical protein
MSRKVSIENLATEVMKELTEYEKSTEEGMKKAVKNAGKLVRNEIKAGAPVKSGDYAKSWAVKTLKENSHTLEISVHSRNRYQLAHLLEHGHVLRNGGRSKAITHIGPAEEHGIKKLEEDIKRSIRDG